MANPQPNEFTKISNEFMDHLCSYRLAGMERQVLDVIIRKTWGYGKKEDYISLSQFVEMTGMKKSNVVRSLSKLITINLIIKTDNKQGCKYQIQKDYEKWAKLSKVITTVIKSDKASLSKVIPTKENTTKENITKEITTNVVSEIAQEVGVLGINHFIGLFKAVNPSYKRMYSNKTERAALERLLEQYGEDHLEQMIGMLPSLNQQKYAPTVTTPWQLENKMGALQAFILKEQHGRSKISIDTTRL